MACWSCRPSPRTSYLAETVLQTALEVTAAQTGISPAGFAVLAMGKLGGGELNYSSDVDLLFLVGEGYSEKHMRAYTRLGERLITALSEATAEGFLYRVDMRLRPWGQVGPLTSTVNGYLRYLQQHARLWEKQALLRSRVVAGDELVGSAFIARGEPLLFASGPEAVRAEVYGMKQQTETHLRQTGRIWGEVKLGEGSIRDVEFVAQYLQLAYGGAHPELRSGNTLVALARLTDNGFLSFEDHRILSEGYTFLRTVEHYLQLLDYRQTHILPEDTADLRYLARRLSFEGRDAGQDFVAQYQQHSAAVRGVYLRHLATPPATAAPPDAAILPAMPAAAVNQNHRARGTAMPLDPPVSALAREHMERMSVDYRATFEAAEVEHHAGMAAALTPEQPVGVSASRLPADTPDAESMWRVTIVGYDYLGVLSLIGGLFFAYGFSIVDGDVYTYEPGGSAEAQRKIVDVFTVTPVRLPEDRHITTDLWQRYAADLTGLVRHLQARRPRAAQGELAKRIAATLRASPTAPPTLPPVDIEIDNDASDAYTVLRISGADTPGFLYEFTNALALNRVHIAQVFVTSGDRVQDTLYVTDDRGQKITSEAQQRELRAATVLVKHFTHLLPRSPNPESALLHFNEYLGELFSRPSWPDELASLERPEVLDALARLLGVSEFLWDDFLRMQYANLFPVVENVDSLAAGSSRAELAAALAAALQDAQRGGRRLAGYTQRLQGPRDVPHRHAPHPRACAGVCGLRA
jgi:[glutamine synthetase] adenylyltransferase / [glutamine synthetase]-adenylyl-L-tyrosine phosphorylase